MRTTLIVLAAIGALWTATGALAAAVVIASGIRARRRDNAIEAIIETARENLPDYFPAGWTEECQ